MIWILNFCCWIFLTFLTSKILCTELTFELEDNKKQCFFRYLIKGGQTKFEYQVITGGNYDVDLKILGPEKNLHRPVIHELKQTQFKSFDFVVNETGEYSACFDNEFSSMSHKIIYFDWSLPEEDMFGGKSIDAVVNHPLSRMEMATEVMHDNLNEINEHQTHYRLNEASGRIFAEQLNNRVMILSLSETLGILVIGLGQVLILRNFFTEKKGGGRLR